MKPQKNPGFHVHGAYATAKAYPTSVRDPWYFGTEPDPYLWLTNPDPEDWYIYIILQRKSQRNQGLSYYIFLLDEGGFRIRASD